MRATTLTSMTVLALLWQSQLCAAESKPLQTPAQASAKSEAAPSKKSASRLGSLSPDEARRAARAHARAAAALKKADPVRAAASAPAKAAEPKKTEQAKATVPAKTSEPAKTLVDAKPREAPKTTDTAKATETDKTIKTDTAKATEPPQTAEHDAVASKPAAPVEHVASQPYTTNTTRTGRSATIDPSGTDARATKRAMRTAERDRKRKVARREARRRTRDRFADDQGPVSSRYYRFGPGDQRVVAADGPGGGYGERVVVVPQPQYRYAPGPSYAPVYPPYPQPYGGDQGY